MRGMLLQVVIYMLYDGCNSLRFYSCIMVMRRVHQAGESEMWRGPPRAHDIPHCDSSAVIFKDTARSQYSSM